VLGRFLGVIERSEPSLPAKDPVHNARVACRRVRAALRLLGARELDGKVKLLQDALGDVRDLQLQAEWLAERDPKLHRQRVALLRKAERDLARAVRRWHEQTLPALLELRDDAASAGRVRKQLRKRLKKLAARVEAARSQTPRAMHRARIAAKQARYLLELSAGEVPKKVTALVADLKSLQATLGELHDIDVRIALLHRRGDLLRDQRDARARLAKVASAQLARWHRQKIAQRARRALQA
jgi:CHAD domain-containing protein